MKQLTNISIGKAGENIACRYLERHGYKIIERNYREQGGEIDIISEKFGNIVFIEVKTMRQYGNGSDMSLIPEDQMSKNKIFKFKRVVGMFYVKHPGLFKNDHGYRLDLVAIEFPAHLEFTKNKLTKGKNNCLIRHYRNIF